MQILSNARTVIKLLTKLNIVDSVNLNCEFCDDNIFYVNNEADGSSDGKK